MAKTAVAEKKMIKCAYDGYLSRYNLDGEINDVIKSLTEFRDANLGKEITLEINVGLGYYDSVECDLEISCVRLETDEEFEARLLKEANAAEKAKAAAKKAKLAREAAERTEYERLLKKYGKV